MLRARLEGVYAGRPAAAPVDRALAAVVARHATPRALLDALLEGFGWDAARRRYEDLAGLHTYAARVAGTVRAMMALLMRERSVAGVARVCDLGIAMQLSNIARDVGENARAGRLYLPLEWLREAGVDPAAWMAAPVFSPAVGAEVARNGYDSVSRRAVVPGGGSCGCWRGAWRGRCGLGRGGCAGDGGGGSVPGGRGCGGALAGSGAAVAGAG